MATYYFDTNGTTAGFGTLTGTWASGSGGALWSTGTGADAGTATPAVRTFVTADTINFGSSVVANTTAGTVTVSGTIPLTSIAITNVTGTQTVTGGTLSINGATSPGISTPSGNSISISSTISGTPTSGVFAKTGTGTLTLSGSNTYTGGTSVSGGGYLFVRSNGALSTSGTVSTTSSTIDLGQTSGGANITIARAFSLSGSGYLGNGAVRNSSGDNTVTGNITITSSNARINVLAGTLTLTGTNTFTGLLTKTGTGRLIFNSATDATSTGVGGLTVSAGDVYVNNGYAIPFGTGTVTVASGASLSAFNTTSPFRMQHTGGLTLNSGSTLFFGPRA